METNATELNRKRSAASVFPVGKIAPSGRSVCERNVKKVGKSHACLLQLFPYDGPIRVDVAAGLRLIPPLRGGCHRASDHSRKDEDTDLD